MDKEEKKEKKEKLLFMERFFLKSFLISFVLLLFSTWMCIVMQDFQADFVEKFFAMPPHVYGKIVVELLGLWKILIIQFTFVPFLALWCIRHCPCCCNKCD